MEKIIIRKVKKSIFNKTEILKRLLFTKAVIDTKENKVDLSYDYVFNQQWSMDVIELSI